MRRLTLGAAEHYGLVAVVNSLDTDDAILGIAILVISHPLAVGPFFGVFIGSDETFESDFSVGRNWQASQFALNHFNGGATHASRPIQFALAVDRAFQAGRQKHQRIGAHDSDDWTRLSALHVFFFDDAAVVWWRGANADAIFVEYLIAIGAGIDDAGIGIAHNVDACGADEPAAVAGMPDRRGEAIQVHFTIPQDIFLNRPPLDHNGRNGRKTF